MIYVRSWTPHRLKISRCAQSYRLITLRGFHRDRDPQQRNGYASPPRVVTSQSAPIRNSRSRSQAILPRPRPASSRYPSMSRRSTCLVSRRARWVVGGGDEHARQTPGTWAGSRRLTSQLAGQLFGHAQAVSLGDVAETRPAQRRIAGSADAPRIWNASGRHRYCPDCIGRRAAQGGDQGGHPGPSSCSEPPPHRGID